MTLGLPLRPRRATRRTHGTAGSELPPPPSNPAGGRGFSARLATYQSLSELDSPLLLSNLPRLAAGLIRRLLSLRGPPQGGRGKSRSIYSLSTCESHVGKSSLSYNFPGK